MGWLDESRRIAFQRLPGASRDANGLMSELERSLPGEIKSRSVVFGNELIVGYDDVLAAINIATEHSIAVLGFDSGEVTEQGFQVLDFSGYDRNLGVPRSGKNTSKSQTRRPSYGLRSTRSAEIMDTF
jgi:hypothetical protein